MIAVKKGGTTQVLLFSDALKNSSDSADWKGHEVRFAIIIEALAPITPRNSKLQGKIISPVDTIWVVKININLGYATLDE